ncbi:J domain-containing protein [Nostoc sphaeroides CHAB 2801]|uniref:J domain-containing protein n=1 Tax=Nostoc sphaeroides TaxID=446679 RepID=UPI001E4A7339|nr:J domain-containing protein [Nostoc sphaeroides]MCC5632883.1 J domain-containing protein [Nostoc sphaeroides CHAB 2801]
MNEIQAYPLTWTTIYPRTPQHKREAARFEVNFSTARNDLLNELRLLGAKNIIISSNVPTRQDGLPYARHKEPDDPGVAVYFKIKDKSYALCCDRWRKVKHNLRAIGLHIAAMRGMERWGVGSVEQAFAGYQALSPQASERKWWEVLGVSPGASDEEVREGYRKLARQHHPDNGGSDEQMAAINAAYEQAKQVGYKVQL